MPSLSQETTTSGPLPNHPTSTDLTDVFGDSPPPSPPLSGGGGVTTTTTAHATEPSEVPQLARQHTTTGYRDGISSAKAGTVQHGFDEGYALGAELGFACGRLLGVLEALSRATGEQDGEVRDVLRRAREELGVRNLFGKEWFGADGVWRFRVGGEGEGNGEGEEELEGEVTFRVVAASHPVVRRWRGEVERLVERYGLVIEGP